MTAESVYQLAKACKTFTQLKQVLAQIIHSGISNHLSSLSLILQSAATFPQPDLCFASSIFSSIEKPSPSHHNAIIRAFMNARNPTGALLFYTQMNRDKSTWDNFTFPLVLKACAVLMAEVLGRSIHGKILQTSFSSDPFARCSLIRMYSELGEVELARVLFDEMPERDTVLWNSMIGGYLKCRDLERAQELFEGMRNKNVGTFNTMLGGYLKFGHLETAFKLFSEMPLKDIISWNTMIGTHARFGYVGAARKLFNDAPLRNLATWSAIISGFAQSGEFKLGLELFEEMLGEGVIPDQAILISALSCCARLGILDQGIWIHGYIEKNAIEIDDIFGASLIDMYSKCGMLQCSISLFNKIFKKGVSSWTSMIYGFAIHGHSLQAIELFGDMEKNGVTPNGITFVAVLFACSHVGLVDKGQEIFNQMYRVHGVQPTIKHYACMVDLLSRANLLNEAQELVKHMPMEPDISVWGALLGGLRIHGALGDKTIGKVLARLRPKDSGTYILLSNIYASNDRWDDSLRMRNMMEKTGVKKNPGYSLIKVDQVVHEFLAGGRLHPRTEQIYDTLDEIYIEIKTCKLFLF